MTDHAQKLAEQDSSQGKGPRDVRNEPSQTQERYNAAFDRSKKN